MLKAAIEGLVWDDTYEVMSADWSVVDVFGKPVNGVTITPNAEDAGKATVSRRSGSGWNTNSRDGDEHQWQ